METNNHIAIVIILVTIVLTVFWFVNTIYTHASESLLGQLFMDFSTGEATYTEHNDFSQSYGVKTSVTVVGTPCGECLRDNNPSACLVKCDEVMLTY